MHQPDEPEILREKVGEEWERMGHTKKKGLSYHRLTP